MRAELKENYILPDCSILCAGNKYDVIKYNSTYVTIKASDGQDLKLPRDKVLLHGKGWRKKI